MGNIAIQLERVSKQYRLGKIGTGAFAHDLNRWWCRMLGKDDPYLKIGEVNDRSSKGNSEYVWALQDLTFDVKQGDVLGVIGTNGAGKSTLLKLLSRTTSPTSGNIKIRGRIASLLEVGTGFHPELTGRENIYLNGAILGMTRREVKSKFDAIVDFSGVERYIDTPVKRYSSGMYVRLAFAVAAHLEPEILIIDEVLAVGDADFQKKAIGKMQDVSKAEGRTVLFVSHQLGAVRDLCKSGLHLRNGMIEYMGEIEGALGSYLSLSNQDTKVPLTERLNRQGRGEFRINSIRLIRLSNNSETDIIFSGDNVAIEVDYECKSGSKTGSIDIHLGMPIYAVNGPTFVTALNNKMSNFYFPNVRRHGTLRCEIPNIPLMAGVFYIDSNLVVDKILEDKIERAFQFQVEPTDFYQSGTPSSFSRPGIYIDQKWMWREKP